MFPEQTSAFSLSDSPQLAEARLTDAIAAIGARQRVDLSGMPPGAAALLLERTSRYHNRPAVLLVADQTLARRTAANLRFFLGERPRDEEGLSQVLLYPAADTTPFIDVSPDRRAAMDRLAVLFRLAQGLHWKFLVLPASAAGRRVTPRKSIASRCRLIKLGEKLDRESLINLLIETGYLRTPLVEDPGSFAVRGALIDVFPPYAPSPARVELDDDLVASIKHFDYELQRSGGSVSELWVHPVKEALLGDDELARAKERLYLACDEVNLPSMRRRRLWEDLQGGRVLGADGLLPACYGELDDLFDYLPGDVQLAVLDPTAAVAALREELTQAERDRDAKLQERSPAFPLEALYLSEHELAEKLLAGRLAVFHQLAVTGRPPEGESDVWDQMEITTAGSILRLGAESQSALVSELKARRAVKGAEAPLEPLAKRVSGWLDAGLRVLLTARTGAQAERLIELLRGYEIQIARNPKPFDPEALRRPAEPDVEAVIGELADGFVLTSEALACVTEEEVFGERGHRQPRAERKRKRATAWLEDLQQLSVGDYVVHAEHGIGRYLGLERKALPLSQYERIHRVKQVSVEVLTVEYAGGDKLFIPITRLNQISRYAGAEGAKPKIDRLGGQTFARAKSRVRDAVRRLADDLLAVYAARAARARPPLPPADLGFAEFEATFPFEETLDQARAIDEVLADLESDRPMDRLICGDVGFGKTEVALRAAFRAAMNGRQVAMLCPTTVLAQQHYLTFQDRLNGYPLRVEVLSRFVPKKRQASVVAALKRGTCDIVIGTHRLLSKDVHFKNLGLLVVDEEQRFGVAHKERLKKLKAEVDVLTLSATPIPRTLQMAIGGLRELSLIATAPIDRRAVRTFITRWDGHVIREAILRELSRGGQIFYVHNRIDSLHEHARQLQQLAPEARIAVAHGRMREAGLEKVMTDFVAGRYDLLCSTAIVENGLDIPRANTMLIDGADMFGLAQLYQLRGRVGRSREQAYCYLIAPSPGQMSEEARTRIQAMERFSQLGSGFQLASLDMELRGAGDLLGAEQSGNVAAVGLELFVRMLEEAIAELRGLQRIPEVDPELTLDMEHYLPEDYVADVGVRLSLYKRFAAAEDETGVSELGAELEDRFGPLPEVARRFVRAMSLKPALRELRVLGCEAGVERVRLHFESDAPIDPEKLLHLVSRSSHWQFAPDLTLTRRFAFEPGVDSIDRVRTLLCELERLRK